MALNSLPGADVPLITNKQTNTEVKGWYAVDIQRLKGHYAMDIQRLKGRYAVDIQR